MDVRFGKSTFNHFNPYQSLLCNVNEQESSSSPIFLPYLTVSDITNHTFLIIDSVYNQSFIDQWTIDYQTELYDSLLSLIPFHLLTRNIVIDYVSLESMNEW